jgi:transglutaminase-like putative cysteine protease
MVITMGAAVLLLDAGLMLAFSPGSFGDLRRAAVALPLIALAVVPSTLLRPQLPYLQGAILFALIAAFVWGERVRGREAGTVVGVCSLAAVAALFVAPALDRHRPWIDYQGLTGGLAPAHVERFDWSQSYGPLHWPRAGHPVLEVQAAHGAYWKAEDLDVFDGRAWAVAGRQVLPSPLTAVSRDSLLRWTQTIHVTLEAISTSNVIGAGAAEPPLDTGNNVVPGASPGTWVTGVPLGPGDSYLVRVYDPHPTAAELAAAGTRYPSSLGGYRRIAVPDPAGSLPVEFPPFHSGAGVRAPAGAATVTASVYGPAFALATRLAGHARTPYAFAAAVERYLSRGYAYDESPPPRPYPLESFLFADKRGYCQQFAGAMALLLRMGGIPARVAAGFTSGSYDPSAHRFVVSDLDAHAWAEAWFPRYGWVRFDPTPAVAPARGGRTPIPISSAAGFSSKAPAQASVRHANQPDASASAAGRRSAGSWGTPALIAVAVVLGLLGVVTAAVALRRRRVPGALALLAELERALARAGRPLAADTTLAALEDRMRASEEAAAYVRAIRIARFAGGGGPPPTVAQRRALRAQLRAGLGLGGAVRALWALPPGWPPAETASWKRLRGIHS